MKTKYALVLSGGGFKGAFQIGALNYLEQHWDRITGKNKAMKFDLISGVSVGALNGAMVASDKLYDLNYIWWELIAEKGVSEIYTSAIIDGTQPDGKIKFKPDWKALKEKLLPGFELKLNLFKHFSLLFSKKKRAKFLDSLAKDISQQIKENFSTIRSLADNSPLKKQLEFYLSKANVSTDFLCGFTSLDTGEYHSVEASKFITDQDFINGVLASTAIPIVYEPVHKIDFVNEDGQIVSSFNNVDGGIRNVSPLGDVVKRINQDQEDCEYVVIIVNCSDGRIKPVNFNNMGLGHIATRSINDIAMTEVFNNDLAQFLQTNDLVGQTAAWDNQIALYDYSWSERKRTNKPLRKFKTVLIEPQTGVLGEALVSTKELFHQRFNHGAECASNAFHQQWYNKKR